MTGLYLSLIHIWMEQSICLNLAPLSVVFIRCKQKKVRRKKPAAKSKTAAASKTKKTAASKTSSGAGTKTTRPRKKKAEPQA